jgi:hypothetical protein
MNVIAYLYEKVNKLIFYSIISVSGLIFLRYMLTRRKINKSFYNREKKKIIRKFDLLFNDISKSASLYNEISNDDRVSKIKMLLEKMQQGDQKVLANRQDKIFYYIFNNVLQAKKN